MKTALRQTLIPVFLTADDLLAIYDASIVIEALRNKGWRVATAKFAGRPEREIKIAALQAALNSLANRLKDR